jgi:hypothetical protein
MSMWLVDTQATLQVDFGSASVGVVTVTITRENGTVIATDASTADNSDGTYNYILTVADNPQMDLLTLDWKITSTGEVVTTYEEIIGKYLFSLEQARAFRDDKLATGDTLGDRVSDEDILEARDEITEFFENTTGVSFIPRYRREIHDGQGKSTIYLDRREIRTVQKLTEDGIILTEGTNNDFVVYPSGRLYREGAVWSDDGRRNVVVDYDHGFRTPPFPIRRAAMIILHSLVVGSDLHDRKIFQQDESGIFRLSFPDATNRRPTGIPYVDARLNEYMGPWGIA